MAGKWVPFEVREWKGESYIVLVYGGRPLGAIQLDHIEEPETTYWHFVDSEQYDDDNPLGVSGSPHPVHVPPGLSEPDQLIWKLEQFEIAECPLEHIYKAYFPESFEEMARRRIAEDVLTKL